MRRLSGSAVVAAMLVAWGCSNAAPPASADDAGGPGPDPGSGDSAVLDSAKPGPEASMPDSSGPGASGPDSTTDSGSLADAQPDVVCVVTDPLDKPTLANVDGNCDGVVGNEAGALFVDGASGNDANPGTKASPRRPCEQVSRPQPPPTRTSTSRRARTPSP